MLSYDRRVISSRPAVVAVITVVAAVIAVGTAVVDVARVIGVIIITVNRVAELVILDIFFVSGVTVTVFALGLGLVLLYSLRLLGVDSELEYLSLIHISEPTRPY